MDQKIREQLETAGINVDEALERFMNNEGLMLKFLLRFPQDENFALLKQGLEQRDTAAAYTAAHTLKGVVGNLAMGELFRMVSQVVEDLRGEDLAAAQRRMEPLEAQYLRTVEALNQLA